MSRFFLIILIALAIICTSCVVGSTHKREGKSISYGKDGTTVEKELVIKEFGDIPAPIKFKRDDSRTFVYEAPGVVIGVVTYEGYSSVSEMSDFFKQRMPEKGWRFMNAFVDENADLFFVKDNRSCQISIRSRTLATQVIVKVGSAE
ncbi:MAG: hypothetical protein R8L53_09930 [Mariprofundales bacterium]